MLEGKVWVVRVLQATWHDSEAVFQSGEIFFSKNDVQPMVDYSCKDPSVRKSTWALLKLGGWWFM